MDKITIEDINNKLSADIDKYKNQLVYLVGISESLKNITQMASLSLDKNASLDENEINIIVRTISMIYFDEIMVDFTGGKTSAYNIELKDTVTKKQLEMIQHISPRELFKVGYRFQSRIPELCNLMKFIIDNHLKVKEHIENHLKEIN